MLRATKASAEPQTTQIDEPPTSKRFVYLACILFSALQTSLFGLYAYLAPSLGVSLPEFIGAFAFGSFLFLFGQPFWAHKSAQWSRERCILIGQLGQLVSLLALIFMPMLLNEFPAGVMLALLLLSRTVYGLTASSIIPSSQAFLADNGREGTYMRSMTAHSIALNIGRVVGPASVLILAPWKPEAILPVYAILLVLCIIVAPKTGKRQRQAGRFSFDHLVPDRGIGRWICALALALTTYVALIQSSLGGIIQLFMKLSPAETAQQVALLTIVGGILTVAVQSLLRKRVKDPRKGGLMIFGAAAILFSALSLQSFTYSWQLWLGVLLMALGLAILVPSYVTAMNLHYVGKSSQAAGSLGVAQTLGFALGGGLSAWALSSGAQQPFTLALVTSALIFILIFRIKQQRALQQVRSL